jgi:flavin reductase (DIM6/NTAB) family NADH-FMN oxidoreductase RutF
MISRTFSSEQLATLDGRYRTNLINSATGYKPANLVGTIGEGISNLAIFSSAVHIGANPPLIGLVFRPVDESPRHTYENIKANGCYTINHIHKDFYRNAHFTSARFQREESEFAGCGLTEEFIDGFPAPFVAESKIKLGVRLVEEIAIESNKTILIVGSIDILELPESSLSESGNIDLSKVDDICISGLDTYNSVEKLETLPYAKKNLIDEYLK